MPTERGFSLFACFFKNHLVSIIPLGKCKLGSVHTVIECSKYRIDRLLYFRCSYIITKFFRCKQPERGRAIRHFEKRAQTESQSQIFIETPYRNLKLFEDFLKECNGNTLLTVAADILQPDQLIRTAQIRDWKAKTPDIHKRPAIFILGV